MQYIVVVLDGTVSSYFTFGLQCKGIDLEISMTHLFIREATKRNMSKPIENVNQPTSFVVSAKSMFQLVSTGDIIGRVLIIYLLVFVDIVVL